MPRVTIIILNWNGLRDILACLESLSRLDYPRYQIVVVDNGSTDGSVEAIQERFLEATLIENGENLGFTGGNNVGLRYALTQGADYALLLNNDTEVAPDFLSRLVQAAEADPTVGMAGPTIYYYARPDLIWSAGGMIDWSRGQTWMLGLNEQDSGQYGTAPREVDFVTGCALLVKRAVTERIGLLDERFFAYYEEAEWCVRARKAEFKIVHVPTAKVWHKIPLDAREHSPLVHYYMTRNRLLFLKVTGASWRAWLHTLLAEYARTLLSWSVRPRWRHKREQRRMMLQAIGDAWRGQWGQKITA
ncbi:MAG: glycosyltransferase family 2 protein [Anaerolineae bacterium]|jgi:GT2 family glycosyltransferase|nr:glycosyltransferase family 2 protein [Anaerolineae bacterium]MDH7473309.1 glycosyltransferase family 2 protein [Anaerolineae bacterium]